MLCGSDGEHIHGFFTVSNVYLLLKFKYLINVSYWQNFFLSRWVDYARWIGVQKVQEQS